MKKTEIMDEKKFQKTVTILYDEYEELKNIKKDIEDNKFYFYEEYSRYKPRFKTKTIFMTKEEAEYVVCVSHDDLKREIENLKEKLRAYENMSWKEFRQNKR